MRFRQSAPLLVYILVTAQTLAAQEEPETPPELSAAERLYGLSLIWQEANYNFAYFDQVPDLDWDSAYRAFIPQVLATGSTFEYYRTLKRFVALLEDGHSTVVEPRALWNIEAYPWVLTRNVQGRVMVANVGRELEEEVPIGSVIDTVDGAPAAQHALEQQLHYVFASTDHYRRDQALGRALNGPAEQPVRVTYVTPDGERRERMLARDRRSREDEWVLPTTSTRPRFEFRWLDDEIAYVALNTFSDAGVVEDFEAALPELYRADALVIDIRHNSGGNSGNGYGIAAYLTDDTLQTSAWRTPEHVAAYKAWGRRSEDWQEYFQMNAWHDGGTHGAVAPADAQRVIVPTVVLQEHATYSAAEDFLVAIDGIPHITTVGRASGGSSGQPLMIDLPGGGAAGVCTKRDTYPDGRDFVGIGIAPDVVVEPTIEDVQAGRDPALEKAVDLLRGRLAEQ